MKNNRKNQYKVALAVTSVLMSAPMVQADSFGTGVNTFDMDFVTIGNAGNTADDTGYGGVDYNYRMGVHEVSEKMINSYNADNAGMLISQDSRGPDRPATSVNWNEAARFVNWLNTSEGHDPAYKFTTGGVSDNIALWSLGDDGYNASNPFRNSNAHYFLPSENEWYKAAYYDPDKSGGAGYYDYATGSDTAPTTTSGGMASGTAVYRDGVNSNPGGPADITNAGGLSPYGTMAQNGNVWEWSESNYTAPNDPASGDRVLRAGSWVADSSLLQSSFRFSLSPSNEDGLVGFRVAAVPEPSGVSLLLIGAVGLLMKRKRG